MIDHITFGVSDFKRSVAFYDQALKPLGVARLFTPDPSTTEGVQVTGYGDDRPWLWLAEEDTTTGKLHIALSASTRSAVDAFYHAALQAGARDNGPPGLRPHYHPNYYAAFVYDPDGHNIEAVCHITSSAP
ncbi:VOC family protein [Epibacterium ulvae]|uniref:VOC family protein n=1 Tax=Epibacterium ulvae TaxID=1156985 RepID=UPI002493141D|nr:VOC family protein [Epibacterium ulvae]